MASFAATADNNITFVISQLGSDLFFKVPEITSEQIVQKKVHNILLCDSSGSMSGYWAKVANGWNSLVEKLNGEVSIILFHNHAFRYTGRTLPLYQPQLGGTNIIAGMDELEKEIKVHKSDDLVRVFFITDGEDSRGNFESRFNSRLEKYYRPLNQVEFYVLGLSSRFPAYISQAIRANVHTGRATIPNLFWSQSCSETEIMKEFNLIGGHQKAISKITLPTDCQLSPFADPTNTFYTGDWVWVNTENLGLSQLNWFECEGNVYQLDINTKPTFDNLLEMFAQWIGQLQLTSIKLGSDTERTKLLATQVKQKMESMYNNYITSLPILNEMKTFTERLAIKQIKTKTYQYQAYLKIATDLASGVRLQFMDNLELAKQLKGVYVGKYSQKAFELRSHTDEDFEKDKENFIKVLENTLPLLKDIESEEHCVITLDNTLDIIRSEGFIDTLKNTTSKIDFLQNIGITGNGVMINITDASTMNPWVTQIKNISTNCAILSTTAIEDLIDNPPPDAQLTQYEKDNCVVAIQVGDGDLEKLNSVIPLFEKKVAEAMSPIIRSRLFQLICTYSIQKSPFTLNYNAHLGALSGLLGYLLTQPKSEWREKTANKIRHTANVYLNREGLQKFISMLWTNPARAVVTEIPNEEIKCESITKLLLMILVSAKDKTQEQIAELMGHVWKEYIGRIIGSNNQVGDWFELTNPELLADSVDFPDFDSIYAHGYTVSETKKAIERAIREIKFAKPTNLELKLNIDKLKKEFNGGSVGNLSWKGLKVFTNSIGYDVSDENIFQYVVHGIRHSGSADRMSKVDDYEISKDWVINELIGLNFAKLREQTILDYKSKASDRYFESLAEEHQTILPMSKSDIIVEANKLDIDVNEETFDTIYQLNPDNKLLSNACMSKDCPYFLHPRADFSSHIERIKANPNFVHSFHRTIYADRKKPVNKIIEDMAKGFHRPKKYCGDPLEISKKVLIEKYSGDIEINKDIYESIYK
jgi:uncharacterized protein YacL (UPF0231 family)